MKKTFKRLLAFMLVAVMTIGAAPLSGFEGLELPSLAEIFTTKVKAATEDYYTYSVSNGEATITDVDLSISGDITIPSTLGGYPVTSIGEKAFCSCDSLTSIEIPDSVTNIGLGAFYFCTSLTNITVDSANTVYSSDGYGVLFNKDKTELIQYPIGNTKTSYEIPDSVTRIGDYAFYSCDSLTSIEIPDSVTSIDKEAFCLCDSLASIIIGNGVTSIGYKAFNLCNSLASVTIGNSVTSMGDFAFYSCDSLTSITVNASNTAYSSDEYGVLFNKDKTKLIQYPMGNTRTSYVIPDSVTSIDKYAFAWCYNLASVEIPDSVTRIGMSAFDSCDSLTSIEIPDSVTNIGSYAFDSCDSLTSIEIPDSVTNIGSGAFSYCNSLASVTIGNGVTSIGKGVFYSCDSLASIEIPDSVTSIGEEAFCSCDSLTSIEIPDSVTSIGDYAFAWCGSLASITVDSANTAYSSDEYGVLFNKNKTELIQYPTGNKRTSYAIPDSVTSIGEKAFCSCDSLASIEIPDSVTNIGDMALYFCDNLTSVTIGNSVTCIGDWAFYMCTSLTKITIPNSVTSIGGYAFSYCDSLTDVYYIGTEDEWNTISIGSYNKPLLNATIHFNDVCEHSYTSVITTPATCTEDGVLTYTCDECGDSYTEIIPATDHAYSVIDVKSPACTLDGLTTYECSNCGNLYADFIDAVGHTPGEWETVTEATCDENGEMIQKCTECGEVIATQEVVSTGHIDGVKYTYEVPNCVEEGKIAVLCESCEEFLRFDPIPPKGHTPGEWEVTTEPTETTVGIETQYCKECGEVVATREIGTLEHTHTPKTVTIPATCTVAGMEYDICETCGETIGEARVIPANGHIAGVWEISVEATCTEKGTKIKKCVVCGTIVETAELPTIDHVTKTVTIPATCTVAGMEYDICESCGETIGESRVIPAKGHVAGAGVVSIAPDCVNEGELVRHCTVCGVICESEVIPANGHTPDEWEVVLEPTATTEGKKIRKCTICGETAEEASIPKKTVVTDGSTGVAIEINGDDYNGEVDIIVEESFDGAAFNLVNTETNAVQSFIYDIRMTVDGEETQPNGKITVKIPLPAGYNSSRSYVYHVDTATGKVEHMQATYKDGYLVFETTHFSYYAIVDTSAAVSVEIRNPSITTINYGDTIVLHADLTVKLPDGWHIKWVASNDNFEWKADGVRCTITPSSSGDTTFIVTVYDAEGNAVSTDEQVMTSKAGFFQKIFAFFKSLFGLNKTYLQGI